MSNYVKGEKMIRLFRVLGGWMAWVCLCMSVYFDMEDCLLHTTSSTAHLKINIAYIILSNHKIASQFQVICIISCLALVSVVVD